MKETDLAKSVVDWMRFNKWEVYQEVQQSAYSAIADIVAVRNDQVWIIECKTSLSFDVVAQANHWRFYQYAHYISIAVPMCRRSKGRCLAFDVLRHYGIGLLEVSKYSGDNIENTVWENIKPQLTENPSSIKFIKNCLHEKHKTYAAAGNAEGKRLTPYTLTCDNVVEELKKQPGLTSREIVERIQHHYGSDTSARGNLLQNAKAGNIRGVTVKQDGRVYRFYLKEGQ